MNLVQKALAVWGLFDALEKRLMEYWEVKHLLGEIDLGKNTEPLIDQMIQIKFGYKQEDDYQKKGYVQ